MDPALDTVRTRYLEYWIGMGIGSRKPVRLTCQDVCPQAPCTNLIQRSCGTVLKRSVGKLWYPATLLALKVSEKTFFSFIVTWTKGVGNVRYGEIGERLGDFTKSETIIVTPPDDRDAFFTIYELTQSQRLTWNDLRMRMALYGKQHMSGHSAGYPFLLTCSTAFPWSWTGHLVLATWELWPLSYRPTGRGYNYSIWSC
jgi:hypothetical protein